MRSNYNKTPVSHTVRVQNFATNSKFYCTEKYSDPLGHGPAKKQIVKNGMGDSASNEDYTIMNLAYDLCYCFDNSW